MTIQIPFDNSYARLPDRFFARLDPTPVKDPGIVRINTRLAAELGLDAAALASPEGAAALAGNTPPEGAAPLAQAYAGHQFGGWSPQLGDGRAHLLGEVIDTNGLRRDIQLKGSGPTPFSRMGDGRAWLGPVLREYIVSEAMQAYGVPTTRALAAVTTGEIVLREAPFPGAVLTRVASSHIRVGTFQFFAARQDTDGLQTLLDYAIERHDPGAADAEYPPLAFLDGVITRQARLVAQWLGLGFIHGVMNTDNTSISGETIDYGPCAFMDVYHPETVFSSIDRQGRYAYNNQPDILVWNLAQLGSALIPLMKCDEAQAVELLTEALHRFARQFQDAWLSVFRAKLGLATEQDGDADLINDLLGRMAGGQADFTNTFRGLADGSARDHFLDMSLFDDWQPAYSARLAQDDRPEAERVAAIEGANPAIIPRNHRVEEAIQAAVSGDYAPFERLTEALETPFDLAPENRDLTRPPEPDQVVHQTFCGT